MAVESAEDRLAFLAPAEFGELATYTPAGGPAVLGVAGVLNDPHVFDFLQGDGPATSDSIPTFIVRSDDLPPTALGGDSGDVLDVAATDTHPAKTYQVVDLQPDGSGMTVIVLGR
jgi:hypothetical protein